MKAETTGPERGEKHGVWRRALGNRELRPLLGAIAVSDTGDWLYSVALVVFVFDSTHSVAWVGASVIVRQAAYMSFSAVGGALADRFDRRRWMMTIDLADAAVLAVMAVVALLDGPPAVVIALAFCASALAAGYHPAVFASIPAIVGEEDLAAANAVVSTIEQVALAAGPALGALVVALSSSGPAFAIDAATFLVAAWLVSRIPNTGHGDEEDAAVSMRDRLAAGVRAITGSPAAAAMIAMVAGALMTYGFEQVLYVAVSADRLGTGSGGVGVMVAVYGAGGLVASLMVGRLARRERPVPVLAAALAIPGITFGMLALITAPVIAYVALFIGGAAFVIFEVVSVTVLQRAVAPKLMGRVFGIFMTLAAATTLVGSVAASAVADSAGLRVAIVIGGIIPIVTLVLVTPLLARLDRQAAARARDLAPRVNALSLLGVFAGAPVATLERLAATLTERPVGSTDAVVREGETADAFFVVRAGTFDVTVERDGQTIPIDELHPSDWFGEVGLVQRIPRTATVRAATDGLVWRIDGDDFLAALEEAPGLPGPFGSLMTIRLARTRTATPDAAP